MKKRILIGTGIVLASVVIWIGVLLVANSIIKSRVPVSLSPTATVYGHDTFAMAKGTWVIEGETQAFPLQTTEINCHAQIRVCAVATAQVALGDQLDVQLNVFEIAEWTKSHVMFVDDSPACVQYIYTINWLTKSANGVRTKRSVPRGDASACDHLDKELRLSLRKGFDVWWQLQEEAMPWFGRLAAAPLRALFN